MAKKTTKTRAKRGAAKPKKPKAGAKKRTTSAVPGEARVISASAFGTLVHDILGEESNKNEAVGNIGQLVKAAVSQHHLDKAAFAIFRKLRRMSDKHLTRTMAHLEHYCEVGGLNERAKKQAALFDEVSGAPSADADQGDGEEEGDDDSADDSAAPAAEQVNGGGPGGTFAQRAAAHKKAIDDAVEGHRRTLAEKASETPPTETAH